MLFSLLTIALVWCLPNVRAADVVCSSVGGTGRYLTEYNSCVCVAPAQSNLPGTNCPTDPHGSAACHGSCGLNCISAGGGQCYIQCNTGYMHSVPESDTSPCRPVCSTSSGCAAFYGPSVGPQFSKAVPLCTTAGTCNYTCSSGQKGCNGQDGCFSTCTPTSAVPARRRREVAAQMAARRQLANDIIHIQSGVHLSDSENSDLLCPDAMTSCPFSSETYSELQYECVDVQNDTKYCGGCPSTGLGVDCNSLDGVEKSICSKGRCLISRCQPGYDLTLSPNKASFCRKK